VPHQGNLYTVVPRTGQQASSSYTADPQVSSGAVTQQANAATPSASGAVYQPNPRYTADPQAPLDNGNSQPSALQYHYPAPPAAGGPWRDPFGQPSNWPPLPDGESLNLRPDLPGSSARAEFYAITNDGTMIFRTRYNGAGWYPVPAWADAEGEPSG
jgi:hypothetical protein